MEKKKNGKKLKRSLNLISIEKDALDEAEMENVFGGQHCSGCSTKVEPGTSIDVMYFCTYGW